MTDGFDVDLAALRRHAAHVETRSEGMARCASAATAAVDVGAYGVAMIALGATVGVVQSVVCDALRSAAVGLAATAGGIEASASAYEGLDAAVNDALRQGRSLLEAVAR